MSKLLRKLEQEISHLETIDSSKSVFVKVGPVGFPMHFDVETLIREKKAELKHANEHLNCIRDLNEELSGIETQLNHLNGPDKEEEEVILYHVGVPFKFSRQELIDKLEKRKKTAQKHLAELNHYVETGEQTY